MAMAFKYFFNPLGQFSLAISLGLGLAFLRVWLCGIFCLGIWGLVFVDIFFCILHFTFSISLWDRNGGSLCIYPFYLYLYLFIAKHLHGAVGGALLGMAMGEIRLILAYGLSFFVIANIYAYLVPT